MPYISSICCVDKMNAFEHILIDATKDGSNEVPGVVAIVVGKDGKSQIVQCITTIVEVFLT